MFPYTIGFYSWCHYLFDFYCGIFDVSLTLTKAYGKLKSQSLMVPQVTVKKVTAPSAKVNCAMVAYRISLELITTYDSYVNCWLHLDLN